MQLEEPDLPVPLESIEARPWPATGWYRYVLHEHYTLRNKRKHWDLRLEIPAIGGLRSFAIPKCMVPTTKAILAIETEVHPLRFLTFQKNIPRGQYGAGKLTILESSTYFIHKATPTYLLATFQGPTLQGTYYLRKVGNDDMWLIGKFKTDLEPNVSHGKKMAVIHISANLPPAAGKKKKKKSTGFLEAWRSWTQSQDAKWQHVMQEHPEYLQAARQWRKLIHQFWQTSDQWIFRPDTIKWERPGPQKKDDWKRWEKLRPIDIWEIKKDFFDPSSKAGQLLITIKKGILTEVEMGRRLAKEYGIPFRDPKIQRYMRLRAVDTSQLWRLLVVLRSKHLQLLSIQDRQAAGREWEYLWSGLGLLKDERLVY